MKKFIILLLVYLVSIGFCEDLKKVEADKPQEVVKEVVLDASVTITSNVTDASVFLDGEKVGKVDEEIKIVKGNYIVSIAADGYEDVIAKKKITEVGVKLKLKFKKRGISRLLNIVIEGVGFGNVVLGKTPEEIIKVLGKPDEDIKGQHRWLKYRKTLGIDVIFPGGIAKEIRFNKGFKDEKSFTHKTKDDIGIGTDLADVIKIYGKPKSTKEVKKNNSLFDNKVLYKLKSGSKIIYRERGILFWFDKQDKLAQFVIFTPRVDPEDL